jgi:hypothetical protein
MKFTATGTARLTRIDLLVSKSVQAYGPLLVQVYSDTDGLPGNLITESSILSGDIGDTPAYCTARFLKSAPLTSGTDYWIVLRIQDDGGGYYDLATTTGGTLARKTDSALSQLVQQTFGFNYKLYTSPEGLDKGSYRFNRDNGLNITVVAYDTSMYKVDEVTGSLVEILPGLNASASEYRFTNGDNKVFWVNGYDYLTAWNGTDETTAINMISNPSFDLNTTNWAAVSGSTLSRVTSDYHSSPASGLVTASSGVRGVSLSSTGMFKNHRYKITYWAKGVAGTSTSYMTVNGGTTALTYSTKSMPATWTKFEQYYTPGVDVTTLT